MSLQEGRMMSNLHIKRGTKLRTSLREAQDSKYVAAHAYRWQVPQSSISADDLAFRYIIDPITGESYPYTSPPSPIRLHETESLTKKKSRDNQQMHLNDIRFTNESIRSTTHKESTHRSSASSQYLSSPHTTCSHNSSLTDVSGKNEKLQEPEVPISYQHMPKIKKYRFSHSQDDTNKCYETYSYNASPPDEFELLDEKLKSSCHRYIQSILINRAWYAQQIFERLLTMSDHSLQTVYSVASSSHTKLTNISKEITRPIPSNRSTQNTEEWITVYPRTNRRNTQKTREYHEQKQEVRNHVQYFNLFTILFSENEDDAQQSNSIHSSQSEEIQQSRELKKLSSTLGTPSNLASRTIKQPETSSSIGLPKYPLLKLAKNNLRYSSFQHIQHTQTSFSPFSNEAPRKEISSSDKKYKCSSIRAPISLPTSNSFAVMSNPAFRAHKSKTVINPSFSNSVDPPALKPTKSISPASESSFCEDTDKWFFSHHPAFLPYYPKQKSKHYQRKMKQRSHTHRYSSRLKFLKSYLKKPKYKRGFKPLVLPI